MSRKNSLHYLRKIALVSALAAASIVLGKLLAINIGASNRISFENLPVLFAGLYLGPVYGMLCGTVADLVGSLMVGYAINPIITVGAASIGLVAGLVFRLAKRTPFRCALSVLSAHLIGSIVIKTAGLVIFYHLPFLATLFWRIVIYAFTGALECLLLVLLEKNTAFQKQMAKFLS